MKKTVKSETEVQGLLLTYGSLTKLIGSRLEDISINLSLHALLTSTRSLSTHKKEQGQIFVSGQNKLGQDRKKNTTCIFLWDKAGNPEQGRRHMTDLPAQVTNHSTGVHSSRLKTEVAV